jgi:hypothetical protein
MRFVICRVEIDSIPTTGKDYLHSQVVWTVFVRNVSCGCTRLRVIDTGPGNSATFQGPLIGSIIRTSGQHFESLWKGNEGDMFVISAEEIIHQRSAVLGNVGEVTAILGAIV